MRSVSILIVFIFSCSQISEKEVKSKVNIPSSINSFFIDVPEITRLNVNDNSKIETWSNMISFTEKFNDLFEKEINHKSKIKLLSADLDKIKKETIPGKYKTSPIIGRIRVVNTYLQ